MARTSNPLKWTGGKTPLASRIVALLPGHQRYLEPFCGAAAVALEHARRFPSIPRTIADRNGPLVAFWQALQSSDGLEALLAAMPRRLPTREEFDAAGAVLGCAEANPHARAAALFVRNRGSRAADMRSFYKPTRRLRRGMDEQLSAWLSALDGLPVAHLLLQGTRVLHADAFDLIERHRHDEGLLVYLDPPYLHRTRGGSDYYEHELGDADHARLLDLVRGARCKVVLSGYRSDLYDEALAGWHREEVRRKNSMAGGKVKRTMVECLWCNFLQPAGHRLRGCLSAVV